MDWCGKEGVFPEIFVSKCGRFGAIKIFFVRLGILYTVAVVVRFIVYLRAF